MYNTEEFDSTQYDGTPTLEHIFEGPTDEQVADYIKSLKVVPDHITDGRSSINPHPDTKILDYLQAKYQAETNNPLFDIRSETTHHMKEQSHVKTRNTTSRLLQNKKS